MVDGSSAPEAVKVFFIYSYGFILKPLLIMANTKTVFLSSEESNLDANLECYCTDPGEIFISIDDFDDPKQYIYLDVSTAIKLSKTLRTEINKAKEVGDE